MNKYIEVPAIVVLTATTGLLAMTNNASAKKSHVAKVSKVRVTSKRVYGHTTKLATVKLVTTKNKTLGHSKANKKGNFIIKTKKNLKKATFKFKVSKKGYVSRTTTFKKISTVSKTQQKKQAPKPVIQQTVKSANASIPTQSTTSENSRAETIAKLKSEITQYQAEYDKINAPLADLDLQIENELKIVPSGPAAPEDYAKPEVIAATAKIHDLRAQKDSLYIQYGSIEQKILAAKKQLTLMGISQP
ncbi:hypothetical protein [Levilactobacillus tongjiangensis]|uniref:Bacterial Ig domain-containing protein n=1 Tax=Levilactobacillus tongjiangensis TaxID=2486023 RepID=A0ABW1SS74_9LACO|nr:hypothetical protein [Levilactobacillus tongjiangensis]